MRANDRNGRTHARQPRRAEKEMAARGVTPAREPMREAVKECVGEVRWERRANPVRALAERPGERGAKTTFGKGGRGFRFESDAGLADEGMGR